MIIDYGWVILCKEKLLMGAEDREHATADVFSEMLPSQSFLYV